jgi:hypothetical protein
MISSLSRCYVAHLRNPRKVRLDVVGMCADGREGVYYIPGDILSHNFHQFSNYLTKRWA